MQQRWSCRTCHGIEGLLIIPTPERGTVEAAYREERHAGGGRTVFTKWRAVCCECGCGFRLGFDDSLTWAEYIKEGPQGLGIGQCPSCNAVYCANCADIITVADNAPTPWLTQPNPLALSGNQERRNTESITDKVDANETESDVAHNSSAPGAQLTTCPECGRKVNELLFIERISFATVRRMYRLLGIDGFDVENENRRRLGEDLMQDKYMCAECAQKRSQFYRNT